MKHVRIKQILTFIAAILLLSAMSVAYVYIGMLSDTDSVMEQIQQKVQSLMPSVSELMRSYDSVYIQSEISLERLDCFQGYVAKISVQCSYIIA